MINVECIGRKNIYLKKIMIVPFLLDQSHILSNKFRSLDSIKSRMLPCKWVDSLTCWMRFIEKSLSQKEDDNGETMLGKLKSSRIIRWESFGKWEGDGRM